MKSFFQRKTEASDGESGGIKRIRKADDRSLIKRPETWVQTSRLSLSWVMPCLYTDIVSTIEKAPNCFQLEASVLSNGRRGGIRTRDPLHPMQVRYQAALHADKTQIITG